jgi:catechol 2,3-dioxygenase-like lactoylglutathione lyase family enzyme
VSGGPARLFDHVRLPVRDIARSRAFYERALQPLGLRVVQSSQGSLGFATDDGEDFWIQEEETAAGSVHTAFAAPDRATVMRSTPQPSRREGSTTNDPVCDLTITPGTTPHSSSTPIVSSQH